MSSLLMDSYLDFFYANEILHRLREVIHRHCEGCVLDSLSQLDHTCLNSTKRQQLSLHFEDILKLLDEGDILVKWRQAVTPLEDETYLAMYELKFNCADWRETMKTPSWKYRMMKLSVQLLRLDKYFM